MTTEATILREPFPHQVKAVEQLVHWQGRGLLCDEMGLGKSSTALWALEQLAVDVGIIVCPLSVVGKWQQEIRETLGKEALVFPMSETDFNKLSYDSIHTWRVVHYEGLLRTDFEVLLRRFLFPPERAKHAGIIFDESHYIANRDSKRSQHCRLLTLYPGVQFVLCATGTPIRNNLLDLWHQVQVARPGSLFDYWRFQARYTKQRSFKIKDPTKESGERTVRKYEGTQREEELHKRLASIMILRKKRDLMDLPPKIRTLVPLAMEEAEAERYSQMKRLAMVTIEEAKGEPTHVIARTALEQIIRLEQMTCGALGGSNLETTLTFPSAAKIQWTLETIGDLREQGRSTAVFCKFNATVKLLHEQIPFEVDRWVLTGDTKATDRTQHIKDFREHASMPGKGGVMLCQLRLAEGFDLTPCTDGIFLGIDWTHSAMDQAEDRMLRMVGTPGTVNCYYPVISKSIDNRLFTTVIKKRLDARKVLEDPEAYMEELQ